MATKRRRKPIWERRNPQEGHSRTMTRAERARAKRAARKAGRTRPSLVDNINAMRPRRRRRAAAD